MKIPSQVQLEKATQDVYLQLFANHDCRPDGDEADARPEPKKSKLEELHKLLHDNQSYKPKIDNSPKDVFSCIKKEMAVFELTGTRLSSLEKIYQALLTIPPTTVEAERAFSAAGLFITKLRTRLDDKSVDKSVLPSLLFQE
jgi:hypothetical protein